MSTDSLQSFQDFVPQSIINRTSNGSGNANVTNNSNNLVSSSSNVGQLNSMMMDYHITPPTSHKGSISSTNLPYNIVHNPCTSDSEEFQFCKDRDPRQGVTICHKHSISILTCLIYRL